MSDRTDDASLPPSLAPGGRRAFGELVARLPDLLDELLACPPLGVDGAAIPDGPDVYLFERGAPGAVRRADAAARSADAGPPGSDLGPQPGVVRVPARDVQHGRARPGLEGKRTRARLIEDEAFAAAFAEAKARVREMTLRFIEIDDQVLRTLFEVCAAGRARDAAQLVRDALSVAVIQQLSL